MRTIEGGKSKGDTASELPGDAAFDQAVTNGISAQLNPSESNSDSLTRSIADMPGIQSGDHSEESQNIKPKIVKPPKQKKSGGFAGPLALLVSLSAAGIAGYSVVSQKTGHSATQGTIESLTADLGSLTTRLDQVAPELAGLRNSIQSNSDRLNVVEADQNDVNVLQITVSTMSEDLASMKADLKAKDAEIDQSIKQLSDLSGQVQKLSQKPVAAAPVKVLPRESVAPMNTVSNQIEGAYVASIDLWGTQPNVMLRDIQGRWVPLSMGDSYRGWRLEGAMGSEAVFQNGSKTLKVRVKE